VSPFLHRWGTLTIKDADTRAMGLNKAGAAGVVALGSRSCGPGARVAAGVITRAEVPLGVLGGGGGGGKKLLVSMLVLMMMGVIAWKNEGIGRKMMN
jgi:hypothetical protein